MCELSSWVHVTSSSVLESLTFITLELRLARGFSAGSIVYSCRRPLRLAQKNVKCKSSLFINVSAMVVSSWKQKIIPQKRFLSNSFSAPNSRVQFSKNEVRTGDFETGPVEIRNNILLAIHHPRFGLSSGYPEMGLDR